MWKVLARRPLRILTATIVGLLAAHAANAQSYPNQPVKVIVQQGAGGSIDVIARIVGEHLSPLLAVMSLPAHQASCPIRRP